MLSGIQEILIITAILLAILLIPRMRGRYRSQSSNQPHAAFRNFQLSGRLRLALLASALWPLGAAIYFEPWHGSLVPFLYYGLGPVLLCWSITWVLAGFAKTRKK